MTKVSRIPLRSDIWDRIFNLFVGTLADLKDENKFSAFVDDFFSPTEKIMFAKRLATCVLLSKNHDYQSIEKVLKISSPTIAKLSLKIKYGGEGIKPVLLDIFNKESSRIMWKEIEDLFDIPTKATLNSPERFKRKFERSRRIGEIKSEF